MLRALYRAQSKRCEKVSTGGSFSLHSRSLADSFRIRKLLERRPMSLTLYLHPLASFCHKVLIAFYENEVAFRSETVDLRDPGSAAELLARWPVGKIPVLYDARRERMVPETSIIIEYVQQHYPGPIPLLPTSDDDRLEARLWDRFFDLYVSAPMQKIVTDRLRPRTAKIPSAWRMRAKRWIRPMP